MKHLKIIIKKEEFKKLWVWYLQYLRVVSFWCSGHGQHRRPVPHISRVHPFIACRAVVKWFGPLQPAASRVLGICEVLASCCRICGFTDPPGASLSSTSCKTLHIAGICRSSPKSLSRKCFTPAQVLCFCAFVRLWCLGFAYVGGFEFFNLSVIPSCLMSPQLSLSISLIDALGNSVR